MSTAAKPKIFHQAIGTVIIAAFALAWLTVPGGPAGAIVNLIVAVVTSTIVVTTVAAFTQLWRVPAVDSTKAGPVLRRMHNGGQRLWTHRRVAVPAVLVAAVLLPYGLEGAALAVALYAAGRAPKHVPEPEPDTWYGARAMAMHLTRAGVLKEGTWLPYQPRVVRDDQHGTTVDVHLPFGMVAAQVVSRRDALASSLGVPPARLTVSVPQDAPANVIRVFVGHATAPGARAMVGSGETSEVADPTITRVSWGNPRGIPIGRTEQGESVLFRAANVHSLICGSPNSGKTRLARVVIAHALLDPDVTVWGINGKGESADWEAMVPACADFHNAVDEDLPEAALRILEAALGHAQAASARSRAQGRAKPSGVLLIEEWAAIRAQTKTVLGKDGLDGLDGLMGRILATARSGGVHVILITQRPQGDSFPIDQRDNVVQRVVLRMTRDEAVRIALGHEPKHAAPTRAGEALLLDDEQGERFVLVDDVPDRAWEGICRRAVALRGSEATPAATEAQNGPESAEAFAQNDPAPATAANAAVAPSLPIDPTLTAVCEVLADGPPQGMTPTAILAALPDHLSPIPPTPAAMGKVLAAWANADDPPILRRKIGSDRLYRLSQPVPAPSHDAPGTVPTTVPNPSGTANDAETGPRTPENGPPAVSPSLPSHPSHQEDQQ